jgi:uncharacterized membrane protein
MRTSLIIFGVIFLVVGVLLYFMPMQVLRADTTTAANGNVDSRTSSARVTVPVEWSLAAVIIGFVLLMLGLIVPSPLSRRDSRKDYHDKDSYDKVTTSKEDVDVGDGNKRKVVREHIETHTSRKDNNSD